MTELKTQIAEALAGFAAKPLRTAALDLLATLGYRSEKTLELDGTPAAFLEQFGQNVNSGFSGTKAFTDRWREVHLLFQLTNDELSGENSLFRETGIKQQLLTSYLFFAIKLDGDTWPRGKLAQIARQLNRLFPMPVMVFFEYDKKLSIAVINRRRHKRDASKDVLGKVTLIQDIALKSPHRGHLDILASFSVPELKRRSTVNSFDTLHAAWEEVFNVELLNRRFYQKIQEWFFWAVQEARFPHGGIDDEDQRNRIAVIRLLTRVIFCWFAREKGLVSPELFSENTARKVLKDFSLERQDPSKIENQPSKINYYLAILQNLFFPTLSVPLDQREFRNGRRYRGINKHYMHHEFFRHEKFFRDPDDLGRLFEKIPFLNGGLFECLDSGTSKADEIRVDGFSDEPANQPIVPNVLFFGKDQTADLHASLNDDAKTAVSVDGLFTILESFKFTVTENTPVEEEIALDPELLGRIFENLLAEYNPETENTARKETGSFYTPRTIVDYMVNETLKASVQKTLCEKLPSVLPVDARAGLDVLFAYTEKEHIFTESEKRVLLDAIYELTILDPACGSGAFPMGMLQKLVYVLEKLDHGHEHWKQRILADTPAPLKDETRKLLQRGSADFWWKLGLIQRCIYGIDIQPIAVQIAKLRCFVSLLVDFRVDAAEENSGVPALPNLDFKFVAADSLIRPPGALEREGELVLGDPFFEQFATLAEEYFFVRDPERKKVLRGEIEKLIEGKIAERESVVATRRRELLLSASKTLDKKQAAAKKKHEAAIDAVERETTLWRSYRNLFASRNAPVGFFDSRYFFPEIGSGFDIVIGNPPYIQIQKFPAEKKAEWEAQGFATYAAMADIYCLFYERGAQLLKPGGHLCYITSNKWMRAGYGSGLREFFSSMVDTQRFIDFGGVLVFNAATVDCCTLLLERAEPRTRLAGCVLGTDYKVLDNLEDYFARNRVPLAAESDNTWVVVTPERNKIKQTVEALGIPLEKWDLRINYGIKTGLNEAFYLTQDQRDALNAREPQAEKIIVPLLRGRYVERYATNWDKTWMIFMPWHFPLHLDPSVGGCSEKAEELFRQQYPEAHKHLHSFKVDLLKRNKAETGIRYEWYALQRWGANYYEDFLKPKIIYPNMTKYLPFYYDEQDHFFINDKAFIMTSDAGTLPYLTAVFNSTLFRCCFIDDFVNLGEDRRELRKVFFEKIPIRKPQAGEAGLFAKLVGLVQTAKREDLSVEAQYLEHLLDACVLELYFPTEMAAAGLSYLPQTRKLLEPLSAHSTPAKIPPFITATRTQFGDIPKTLTTASPNLFATILAEGKV